MRLTHVAEGCRSIKLISLGDESIGFELPKFGQLFPTDVDEHCGHTVGGLVLRYVRNTLIDNKFIQLQDGLLLCCQPFHNPTTIEHLELDCLVEHTNANQGIMGKGHNIWVQYTQSEAIDLNHNFPGGIIAGIVVYIYWTPLIRIFQIQEYLESGRIVSTLSKWCKKTEHCILHPQAQE